MSKDCRGVEICAPKKCPACGEFVSTRPDGSLRWHGRWRSPMSPRLGVVTCDVGQPTEPISSDETPRERRKVTP